jgi:hypothetical protein
MKEKEKPPSQDKRRSSLGERMFIQRHTGHTFYMSYWYNTALCNSYATLCLTKCQDRVFPAFIFM